MKQLLVLKSRSTPVPRVESSQSTSLDSSLSNPPPAPLPTLSEENAQQLADSTVLNVSSMAPQKCSSSDQDRMDFLLKMADRSDSSLSQKQDLPVEAPANPVCRSIPPLESDFYPGCEVVTAPQPILQKDYAATEKKVAETPAQRVSKSMPPLDLDFYPGCEVITPSQPIGPASCSTEQKNIIKAPAQPAALQMPPLDSDFYPGCEGLASTEPIVETGSSFGEKKAVQAPAQPAARSTPEAKSNAPSACENISEPELVIPGSDLVRRKAARDQPYRTVLGALSALSSIEGKYQPKSSALAANGPLKPSTKLAVNKPPAKKQAQFFSKKPMPTAPPSKAMNYQRGPKLRLSIDKLCRPAEDVDQVKRMKHPAGPKAVAPLTERTTTADEKGSPRKEVPSAAKKGNSGEDVAKTSRSSSILSADSDVGPPIAVLDEATTRIKQLFQKLQMIRTTQEGSSDSKLASLITLLKGKDLHLTSRAVTQNNKHYMLLSLSYRNHHIIALLGSSEKSPLEAERDAVRNAVLTWLSPLLSRLNSQPKPAGDIPAQRA